MADMPETQATESEELKLIDRDIDILVKYLSPDYPEDEMATEDCPEPDRIEAVVSGRDTFTDAEKSHVEAGCKYCAVWIEIMHFKIDPSYPPVSAG